MFKLANQPVPKIDFDTLVREHQGVVMGLAHSMGLRNADLDDAAAEAFAAVFRALPGYRGEAQLSTWVYRIAWRTILKIRGKRSTLPALDSVAPPVAEGSPGEAVELSETSLALWSAVRQLDPMQSAAVELYYRRDWPVQNIADVLNCPTGTVKTLLFRARAKLRETLTKLEVFHD